MEVDVAKSHMESHNIAYINKASVKILSGYDIKVVARKTK